MLILHVLRGDCRNIGLADTIRGLALALEWIAVFILQYFCQLMQSGGDEAGAIAPGFGAEGLVSFAMSIATIVSGGQSGVDRGALEAAVAKRVEYRGWCPLGGWAEDHTPGDPRAISSPYGNARTRPTATHGVEHSRQRCGSGSIR